MALIWHNDQSQISRHQSTVQNCADDWAGPGCGHSRQHCKARVLCGWHSELLSFPDPDPMIPSNRQCYWLRGSEPRLGHTILQDGAELMECHDGGWMMAPFSWVIRKTIGFWFWMSWGYPHFRKAPFDATGYQSLKHHESSRTDGPNHWWFIDVPEVLEGANYEEADWKACAWNDNDLHCFQMSSLLRRVGPFLSGSSLRAHLSNPLARGPQRLLVGFLSISQLLVDVSC